MCIIRNISMWDILRNGNIGSSLLLLIGRKITLSGGRIHNDGHHLRTQLLL